MMFVMGPRRIRHVIPVPDREARHGLHVEFQTALRSIHEAVSLAPSNLEIELIGAHFSEDPPPPVPIGQDCSEGASHVGLKLVASLTKSAQDFVPSGVSKKLPLLREVLDAFGEPEGFDVCILTNSDIHVRPDFYRVIDSLVRGGVDAGTITRRTVEEQFGPEVGVDLGRAQVGLSHPGSDCFFFPSALLPKIDVGDVTLGISVVNASFLANLYCRSKNFHFVRHLALSYHFGNDKPWLHADYRANDEFVWRETLGALGRLAEDVGDQAVVDYWLRHGPRSPPPPPLRQSQLLDPSVFGHPRQERCLKYVFVAADARSGTKMIAKALGQSSEVVSRHESEPSMTGPVLSDVQSLGLEATFRSREHKVAALLYDGKNSAAGKILLDSSHMFLKTYADVVLGLLSHEDLGIIDLRRNPVSVVRSFYQLGYFTPENDVWSDWLVDPRAPEAFFKLDHDDVRDEVDLIIASLIDTNERKRLFRSRTPRVKWVQFRTENSSNRRSWRALVLSLGLERSAAVERMGRTRVNEKRARKAEFGRNISVHEGVFRIAQFVEKHQSREAVRHFVMANRDYFAPYTRAFPALSPTFYGSNGSYPGKWRLKVRLFCPFCSAIWKSFLRVRRRVRAGTSRRGEIL